MLFKLNKSINFKFMFKDIVYVKKMQLPSNSASALQTLNMSWAFAENRFDVKLCVSSKDRNIVHNIINNYSLNKFLKPNFFCIKTKNKGLYSLLFFIYIVKSWIFNKKSIFIARDLKEGHFISILKKYLKRGHLFVYEMHDSVYLEKINSLKIYDFSIHKKEDVVLNSADLVIYTGPYLKKIVENLYNPQSISCIIPPGYNPNIFTPVVPKGKQKGCVKLAYFGTLFPNKGVDVFIDALFELPPSYLGVIVGGNPTSRLEELKRRVRELGLSDRVSFSGQVAPTMVPLALSGVDAIVIPFQTETDFLSPIKLYEALALGLPIIATPTPALIELSQTFNSLVISDDATEKSLANCIYLLFNDGKKLNFIRRSANIRRDVFTWKDRAKIISDFISKTEDILD